NYMEKDEEWFFNPGTYEAFRDLLLKEKHTVSTRTYTDDHIDLIAHHHFNSQMLSNFTQHLLKWIETGNEVDGKLQLTTGAHHYLTNWAVRDLYCYGGKFYHRQIMMYLEYHKEDSTLVANAHIGLNYLIISLDTRINYPI
ncbi:hypothetical protein, partial [Enterococcus faecalis]|uniref:hypothetical protein n=1 Tax=Enterococcus faecalis TaxID=1351 RepID=UPI001E51C404